MNYDPGLHNLIRQIGNGDTSALERLIAEIGESLGRYLSNRYMPPLTREDIEDVVEITFIKVYLNARSYKGIFKNASAKNWIFSIARNLAIRLVHSGPVSLSLDDEKHKKEDGGEPSAGILLVSTDNTEDQALDLYLLKEFRNYVQALPEREREILKMRIDDLSLDQIAAHFQVSKARISQILTGIVRNARNYFGVDE